MTDRAPQTEPDRLHSLDALRAGALLLGLVVHASMAFMAGTQGLWIVHDPAESAVLGLGFFIPHMFRMLVFFLIAGLFARKALERRGTRAFVHDRFRRIGLVLVGFWPITLIGIIGASIAAQRLGLPVPPAPVGDGVPLFHLWFLYVLMLLYSATVVLRALAVRIGWRGSGSLGDAVLTSPLAPALMAAPLVWALQADPHWIAWFGVPTPDQLGLPGPAALAGFGGAYALGWWLAARLDVLNAWARQWPFHLAVAALATALCLWLSGFAPGLEPLGGARRVIVAGAYALGGWSWTIALVGMAHSLFARMSPVIRHLADASYWIYLMHLPVVMALQALVIPLPVPLIVKFAVVVGGALILLLASYGWFVRRSWLGAWLNGRRRD